MLNFKGSGNQPGPFVFPVALFAAFYLAALYVSAELRLPYSQWGALVAAIIATVAAIAIWDHGKWDVGLRETPVRALVQFAVGILFAVALIGTADLLILLFTPLRHTRGDGFPFFELVTVYLPAAAHEELLFRGYPFQKIWKKYPLGAIVGISLLFALLHAFNDSVTILALTNIFLGGVLLSLAYVLFERLWLPLGLHLAWNLMSGPVLGYSVSGFVPEASVLRTSGNGPDVLTGGGFGIEGSILLTAVELVGLCVLCALCGGKLLSPQRTQSTQRNS